MATLIDKKYWLGLALVLPISLVTPLMVDEATIPPLPLKRPQIFPGPKTATMPQRQGAPWEKASEPLPAFKVPASEARTAARSAYRQARIQVPIIQNESPGGSTAATPILTSKPLLTYLGRMAHTGGKLQGFFLLNGIVKIYELNQLIDGEWKITRLEREKVELTNERTNEMHQVFGSKQ